jgi:hypothetical protein
VRIHDLTILEYLNTPADLYQMALEVGAEWRAGIEDAKANMAKAAELKQAAAAGTPRAPMQPRMPRKYR